jgi:uncharacterized membrane protein
MRMPFRTVARGKPVKQQHGSSNEHQTEPGSVRGAAPRAFGVIVLAAYPLLIWLGATRFEPRVLVLFCLLGLVASAFQSRTGGLRGMALYIPVGLYLALTIVTNAESVLRLYPVVMNLSLGVVFALSLANPPTAIERLARLQTPDLSPEGVDYCRGVTWVWIVFFAVNGAIALWTALATSLAVWTLYNGLISYVCMGVLFGVEYLVRIRYQRRIHDALMHKQRIAR